MNAIELVSTFCEYGVSHVSLVRHRRMGYNPQGIIYRGFGIATGAEQGRMFGPRPNLVGKTVESYSNFPTNVLEYPNLVGKSAIHPTQKPVEMLEFLIRSYTAPGDTVLDFTAGYSSTGVP